MQTIQTKFLSVTDTKGARIKATNSGGTKSIIISYPFECDVKGAHAKAAIMLRGKLGWEGEMIQGTLSNGANVFIFVKGSTRI